MSLVFRLRLLLFFIPVGTAIGEGRRALIPGERREDFENGSISGWSSHPASTEPGYDFTILPGYERPRYDYQGAIDPREHFSPVSLAPPETLSIVLLDPFHPSVFPRANRAEDGLPASKSYGPIVLHSLPLRSTIANSIQRGLCSCP